MMMKTTHLKKFALVFIAIASLMKLICYVSSSLLMLGLSVMVCSFNSPSLCLFTWFYAVTFCCLKMLNILIIPLFLIVWRPMVMVRVVSLAFSYNSRRPQGARKTSKRKRQIGQNYHIMIAHIAYYNGPALQHGQLGFI